MAMWESFQQLPNCVYYLTGQMNISFTMHQRVILTTMLPLPVQSFAEISSRAHPHVSYAKTWHLHHNERQSTICKT